MIKAEKRFLAFVLALVMICAVLPWQAYAATSVSLLDGKVTLDATSVQGTMSDLVGGVVTVPATPSYDSCSKSYSGTSSTVKFTNNSGNQATISFTYPKNSYVSSVTINGTANTTGSASVNVAANNGNFTVVVKGVDGTDQVAEIYLTDFKIVEQKEVTLTYGSAVNGSFTVNSAAVAAGGKLTVLTTDTVALSASPAANYSFAGWYNEVTGKYFSFDKNASVQFEDSATIVPKFIPSADAVFGIGDAVFASLDDAIASAIMGSVIFPLKNVTLTKDYTIPANVTLLVPFNAEHTCYTDADIKTASYVAPSVYRTLTLADGVTLTVNGAISVSAKHFACDGANPSKGGAISGPYGLLKLNGNSKVDIQSGGVLYAWGYVIGSGEVVANSGATIHEIMQVTDFRGGNGTAGLVGVDKSKKVFPFSQYYVQNVEAKEVLYSGAKLVTTASITASSDTTSMAVTFIGEGGMFALSEGTTVTKEYDAATDRLIISSNGDVTLSGISLAFAGQNINSADFYLPINSNITININSGVATVNQDLVMHPGSELNVAKGAQVFIPSGVEVFVYDADNWGNFVFSGKKYTALSYIASTGKASTRGTPGDAIVNINGTIGVVGSVYTSAAGAQIISSEGDGVFFHMSAAPVATTIYGCTANGSLISSGTFTSVTMNPADLRNGDGSVTATLNAKQYSGFVYNKTTETWETLTDAVITFDANGGTGSMDSQTVTALNQAQGIKTALTANAFSNGGATFLGWSTTKDGEVIYLDGEEVIIYRDTTLYAKWQPTAVEITWVGGSGDAPEEVEYGTIPSYKGSTPTKAASGCTTYTFAGWMNSTGTKYPVGTALPAATADEAYAAYFTESTSHVGDTDNDHKCNGCSTPLTDCADTNNDHICDYAGCKATLSTCVDDDRDHYCDYSGCKAELSTCVDGDDENHNCDYVGCGKENVDDGCHGGKATCMAAAVCDECGQPYGSKDATNHTKQNTTVKDAVTETCGKEGYTGDTYCECGEKIATGTSIPATGKHYDNPTDGNHSCDVCNAANVTKCSGGTAYCNALAVCSDCGESYGEFDKDNHASSNFTFVDNKNGTHTKKHACCSAEVVTEGHTYVNGHCDCEAVQTFTVTWVDAAGKAVDSETVTYGGNATKTPAVPTKDGYTGVWNKTATNVTSDVTITPVYTIKSYQISFDTDGDGTVNYSASYNHFANLAIPTPVLPQNNAQYTYAFDCWKDQNGNVVDANTVVTGAMTVTMYYTATINTYTVTWDVNGVKTEQTYKYGDTPVFSGSTDKAADGCTVYTFTGWDKEIATVTGNVTYTATYTEGVAHVGGTTIKGKVDATCGEDGYTGDIHCATCDALLTKGSVDPATGNHVDGNDDNHDCDNCDATNVDDGCYGGKATCMAAAVCDECGQPYGSKDATNHTKQNTTVKDAVTETCGKAGYTGDTYCECGEKIATGTGIPATGKHYDNPADGDHSCDTCSATDITKCSGGTAYCNTLAICSDCEQPYGELNKDNHTDSGYFECETEKTHRFYHSCCGTYSKSVTCSDKAGDGDHQCDDCVNNGITDCVSDAVYTCQSGTCVECGAEVEAAGDHDADHSCDKNCTICGEEIWPWNDHERVNDCDTQCKHCGEEIWPDAQCESDADYACQDGNCIWCGAPVSATEKHDWVDPDCENNGYCSNCGTDGEPALGHGKVEGWEYNELDNDKHEVWCKDCYEYTYNDGHDFVNHVCKDCGATECMSVKFYNGQTLWTEIEVPYGSTLGIAGMPVPEATIGYHFSGWYNADGVHVVHGMTITEDTVAYATFAQNVYTLSITYKGTVTTYQVEYGAKLPVIATDSIITEDGKYTFWYWADMDAENISRVDELPGTMPAHDLNYEAIFNYVGWVVYDGERAFQSASGLLLDGWNCINDSNEVVTDGSGDWYYFDPDTYYAATGISRVPYNTELGYGPDQETLDYCESKGTEFIDATSALFYFGEDGKFQSDYTGPIIDGEYARYAVNGHIAWHVGLIENQGAYFYFKGDEVNGGNKMVTGCDYYVSRNKSDFNMVVGGIYTFDNDGKLQWKFHGIVESELFEGKRYYIGGRLAPGLGLVDLITAATGEVRYFYVDAYGQLILDAEYYIGANSLGIPKGVYYFDAEGFLVMPEADPLKNGFYFENGNWFYYVDGVKGYCAGLISTSGILWFETADAQGVENEGWVYVKSNGALATGEYYVTNVQENCVSGVKSGDLCKFGSNGLMQTAKSGIVDGYYYENNAIAYGAGLIKIDGSYYYVRSNGQVVMGRSYWITKTNGLKDAGCYEFDADGKMIVSDKNGVVAEDGALYYYVHGIKQIGNGLVTLEDGSYIYVRSNGQLATGLYWTTNHNGVLTEGMYDFGENGILVIE